MSGRLRAAGLKVRTQEVRFPFFDERRPPRVTAGGDTLREGRALKTLRFSGEGEVEGPVRAVGLRPGAASDAGCAPADFARVEKGDVVVVQRGTCTLRRKADNARRAGAAAVLIANDGRPGRTDSISGTLGSPGVGIPVLSVGTDAGGRLARADRARVKVSATSETRTTHNVLAETRGAAEGDVVMAGGHLDSVEEGPGINDNASGAAALLEMARRADPEARLRFAFWGAEEVGLVGSRRYVRTLGAGERKRIRAYVNLDMVGSPNAVTSFYADTSRIERALRGALRRSGKPFVKTRVGGASDHAPFARAKIPVGGFFTGAGEQKTAAEAERFGGRAGRAKDPCYHRACDTQAHVDRATITRVARAADRAVRALSRTG